MTKSIPKIDVVCQQCGKPFKTWNYKLKNGRGKFCSKECFYISHRKEKPTRICKQCGKEFETRQSYINYGQEPKYCSQKCLHESQKKRVAIKCPICEKIFYDRPSKIKEVDQIFCSNECYRKSISMRTSGPNNHNWIGGISFDRYCIKFNNNFKERVRSFFNYTCVEVEIHKVRRSYTFIM